MPFFLVYNLTSSRLQLFLCGTLLVISIWNNKGPSISGLCCPAKHAGIVPSLNLGTILDILLSKTKLDLENTSLSVTLILFQTESQKANFRQVQIQLEHFTIDLWLESRAAREA